MRRTQRVDLSAHLSSASNQQWSLIRACLLNRFADPILLGAEFVGAPLQGYSFAVELEDVRDGNRDALEPSGFFDFFRMILDEFEG